MIVHILQMWELKQRGIKDVPQITWRSRVRKLLATLCWMGDSEGPRSRCQRLWWTGNKQTMLVYQARDQSP